MSSNMMSKVSTKGPAFLLRTSLVTSQSFAMTRLYLYTVAI